MIATISDGFESTDEGVQVFGIERGEKLSLKFLPEFRPSLLDGKAFGTANAGCPSG
jgi:hypothetical protein